MKIPETSANVGAYYGNEENGQWQPNGVIIDSGVGGGVVGSGDAGLHRPVYPVHIPRGHIPAGYVMAGAFYPPAPYAVAGPTRDDFEDYMWMENEEEFDKQVMQQLEEEALMEQCIEAMLEDEQREQRLRHDRPTSSNGRVLSLEETVSRSTLNPLAAEFVPTFVRADPQPASAQPAQTPQVPQVAQTPQVSQTVPAEETKESTEVPPTVAPEAPAEERPTVPEERTDSAEVKTEESKTSPETPEVSLAEVTQAAEKRPKEAKKDAKPKEATKKPLAKVDSKAKVKPVAVKSEPKVPSKKKEARLVRSDVTLDEPREAPAGEAPKLPRASSPPSTVLAPAPAPSGPKPINYAAAARANKPRKLETVSPVSTASPVSPVAETLSKKDKIEKKEKPIQRKNSAK